MSTPISRMTVIGDGAMGTLCALMAADRGSLVTLWGRSSERIALLAGDRENCRYLPGHPFPASISLTSSKGEAFPDPTLIVSAVPCQYIRKVWQGLAACQASAVRSILALSPKRPFDSVRSITAPTASENADGSSGLKS
ncbi:MAG: hypothetical protein IIA40_09795 [SAR324 cluster bacterium]|nr:hypothetical protein [SAR324 cluster bacterium]